MKDLAALFPMLSIFWEAELKVEVLVYLVGAVSRQHNVQAVAWAPLASFSQKRAGICSKEKQNRKIWDVFSLHCKDVQVKVQLVGM